MALLLAAAIPVLVAWVGLWARGEVRTWFLAPTLAVLAFGIWGPSLEPLLAEAMPLVAARAASRVLLLVALPLGLLYAFGEGNMVPGWPALGLGREGAGRSLAYGVGASLAIVPLAVLAVRQAGGQPLPLDAVPFVVVEAAAEEIFFRGLLLIPLVPLIGRGGALAVSASSFLLTRPTIFLTAAPVQVLPRPFFAAVLLAVALLLGAVALHTRHVLGAVAGRSIVRAVPALLP